MVNHHIFMNHALLIEVPRCEQHWGTEGEGGGPNPKPLSAEPGRRRAVGRGPARSNYSHIDRQPLDRIVTKLKRRGEPHTHPI